MESTGYHSCQNIIDNFLKYSLFAILIPVWWSNMVPWSGKLMQTHTRKNITNINNMCSSLQSEECNYRVSENIENSCLIADFRYLSSITLPNIKYSKITTRRIVLTKGILSNMPLISFFVIYIMLC